MTTLERTWRKAVVALMQLREVADTFGPCSEQSRVRDALEAMGLDRDILDLTLCETKDDREQLEYHANYDDSDEGRSVDQRHMANGGSRY